MEHIRADVAEAAQARDGQTRQLLEISARLGSLTRSVEHLEQQGREAHDTTRLVDRRAAADAEREAGADNRRSLIAVLISAAVAVWTFVRELVGAGQP